MQPYLIICALHRYMSLDRSCICLYLHIFIHVYIHDMCVFTYPPIGTSIYWLFMNYACKFVVVLSLNVEYVEYTFILHYIGILICNSGMNLAEVSVVSVTQQIT
jgi:hypothetical protein